MVDDNGKIVIPEADQLLQIRIIAVAHQGHHGHYKARATVKLIREAFVWPNLSGQTTTWVGRCLQCIKLEGGKLIPRPGGHQLTATRPMEVVAIDFLAIRANRHSGYKYVLIIVCQLTRICVCVATKDATALTAARIFTDRWLAIFPEPVFVITDGGPHFKATLFREIAQIRGFNHHIVAPYSQWANGGVERLNQHFTNRLKALLNARSADWTDWPAFVPAIQEVMNKRLAIRDRGGKTPLELLTGVEPRQALSYVAWLGVNADVRATVDPQVVQQALQGIHDHLPLLWAEAVQAQTRRRGARRIRPGITVPRINVGDLVLVAQTTCPHKLRMHWTGPHEVTATVNKYCYRVRPLLPPPQKRPTITAHIVRIRRFSNAALGTAADRRRMEESAVRDFPDNFVHRFLGFRRNPVGHQVELRVRWLGFDAAGDTWEPVASLVASCPDLVEAYIRENDDPMLRPILARYF